MSTEIKEDKITRIIEQMDDLDNQQMQQLFSLLSISYEIQSEEWDADHLKDLAKCFDSAARAIAARSGN